LATTKATVQFTLASLAHDGSKKELKSLLDFGRLGVKQGSEGLEFGGKIAGCGFHGWGCDFWIQCGKSFRLF
jgi:hypothetical protein